jgi:serine/threonine-protein kinase HipA
MSAQPNVDAGQIGRNRMKLAMAVGSSRHYVIDSITPRHFLQTAAAAGVPAALVDGILDEIESGGAATSVADGIRRRLRLLTHATA